MKTSAPKSDPLATSRVFSEPLATSMLSMVPLRMSSVRIVLFRMFFPTRVFSLTSAWLMVWFLMSFDLIEPFTMSELSIVATA